MKNINFTYIDYFFKSYSKHYRNFAAKFQFNAISKYIQELNVSYLIFDAWCDVDLLHGALYSKQNKSLIENILI